MQGQKGWVAEDLKTNNQWLYRWSQTELEVMDKALERAKAEGLTLETMTRENFHLDGLRSAFDRMLTEIEEGLGFFVLRGVPAARYTKDEMRMLYWGMGLHIGTAVTQSNRGDMLGDVRNFGVDTFSKKGRGYMSNQFLQFHSDTCDVVCLMVLRAAKSGGLSRYCSSLAIHDEVAKTRPDLLEELYKPFHMSWKGQEAPGQSPYYQQPVFSKEQGIPSSRFIPQHIVGHSVPTPPELPALTPKQKEAIEYLVALANDPRFYGEMMFEPGDMQFMNNHVMWHSRTEFEDHEEDDRRRHLIRMWLSVPNSRPLNDSMNAIYRDRRPGAVRGGFPCFTGARVYETPTITD